MLHNPETWVLLPFLVFVALAAGRLWKLMAGALDARADAVRAELAEAQRLRHEAETMLAEATKARDASLAEAGQRLDRARTEAARLTEAMLVEAETSAKRRERMALERIAATERAVIAEMQNLAAEIATTAAERVLRTSLDAATGAALVEHAIASLPQSLRAA